MPHSFPTRRSSDLCVLPAASCIGAAELVEFLLTEWRGFNRRFRDRCCWHRSVSSSSSGAVLQVGKGLAIIGHYAPTLFLRLREAISINSVRLEERRVGKECVSKGRSR